MNNTVVQFDPVTGKLLKTFPANEDYPDYGLSQDDLESSTSAAKLPSIGKEICGYGVSRPARRSG
jgi:hypothetical protein